MTHQSYNTPAKRKQRTEEYHARRAAAAVASNQPPTPSKRFKVPNWEDITTVAELRRDVYKTAKKGMSKREKRLAETQELVQLGAKVKSSRDARVVAHGRAREDLRRKINFYEEQVELGVAEKLSNPQAVHNRKMRDKYENSATDRADRRGMRLHGVGRIAKDGTTLSFGSGAHKHTEKALKQGRSGGSRGSKMFKKL